MSISAIIFDLDGVITDTEPIHLSAWRYILRREGIKLTDDDYKNDFLGLNDEDFVNNVGRKYGRSFSGFEAMDLIKRKLQRSLSLLKIQIPVLPGMPTFINLVATKLPIAICSGSIRREIDFILKEMKMDRAFNPIISGDDVTEGKPHPQGYLLTLSKLKRRNQNIEASTCLVIEDSPKGITAAKSAGMKCLALTNSYSEEYLKEADWLTDNITNLPSDIKSLLQI